MNKKIGIITFHCSYNYGSALQAYALQKYLNKNYSDTKIIDFVLKKNFEQYYIFRYIYYKKIKYFFEDLKYFKKNMRRRKSFIEFKKKYFSLTQKTYYDSKKMGELNNEFDTFICGSDQIWNAACTNGLNPAYFLKFVNNKNKKIAYAPSIAHLNFDEKILQKYKDYISEFDAISVREESTVNILMPLTNKKIEVVLDPTLLLEKNDYMEITQQPKEKKYIFVYMLEDIDLQLINYVKKISENTGLKVIYLLRDDIKEFKNSKNVYGISPNEFLGYIENATYIITNSFHATVFSIIFEKKFCTFKTKLSYSRMVDLLTKLNLSSRIYDENFDMNQDIDYSVVSNLLAKLKQSSVNYLERNLK